jgi:hypothetical protein
MASGFQTVHEGDNSFVCGLLRGFIGAPTYTPVQVRDCINCEPSFFYAARHSYNFFVRETRS